MDELRLGARFRALPQSRMGNLEMPDRHDTMVTLGDFGSLPARALQLRRHDPPVGPADVPDRRIQGERVPMSLYRKDYFQLAYLTHKGADARLRAEGVTRFRERIARRPRPPACSARRYGTAGSPRPTLTRYNAAGGG
ncbi:hypothetical protein [Nonomuraea sp. MG754425]|uniref:hypothetical protein n=1 Tax=Nonomuraea sp. MG754425 TaxID=2570319 RepID=UPI001F3A6EB2|nr:hypothetical protein [Nonomuraea sp. MG754425]